MFTIALAFLIFSGTSFALISDMIIDVVRLSFGADMFISAGPSNNDLPYSKMKDYFDTQVGQNGSIILGYTFTGK